MKIIAPSPVDSTARRQLMIITWSTVNRWPRI